MKTIFITGTDTDVGKTFIGTRLTEKLLKSGLTLSVRKPIESGCQRQGTTLVPADASDYVSIYNVSSTDNCSLDDVCRYRYEPAISPQRAITLADETVSVEQLLAASQGKAADDVLLVEGAGGFYSPLCSDGLNADLAEAMQAQVILVVRDRLGCINQALLSLAAIESRGLECFAVVVNQIPSAADEDIAMDNLADLRARLKQPVLPYNANESTNTLDKLLNLIRL
ncbi:MAG: dethiobiotin synthase [Gammaproteobacteria bacterium]|nr:dethiobiotin synthase [Gammaproteobacteria bacterium]